MKWCGAWTVVVLLIVQGFFVGGKGTGKGKICVGTEGHFRMFLEDFKARYEGCTHIVGNLEMRGLHSRDSTNAEEELTFLRDIEEVSGYLLIEGVTFSRLTFSSLHTIRGESLFRVHIDDPEYALLTVGSWIDHLEFPALREIFNGSVGMYFEKRMCFLETINWRDILMDESAQFHYFPSKDRQSGLYVNGSQSGLQLLDECGSKKCHARCVSGCWGKGANQCQKLSKAHCNAECGGSHCFGRITGKCCHSSCLGGCTGPTRGDCSGCKNVYFDGECKDSCPPGKFSFATSCVDICPNGTVLDEETRACLFKCPRGKYSKFGKCESVQNSDKLCRQPSYYEHVHSGNIEYFRNCTMLDGNIFIDTTTFFGGTFRKNFTSKQEAVPMPLDKLAVFSTLREIKGTLKLWYVNSPQFSELTFFENLETVGRRYALDIRFTSLKRIHLRNLKEIRGDVQISQNRELCFVNSVNWPVLTQNGTVRITNNRGDDECQRDQEVCNRECSAEGCWGPQRDDCVCLGYRLDGRCVSRCPEGTYSSGVACLKCHENCLGGCRGPSGEDGPNGCKPCYRAIVQRDGTLECLGIEENCPNGYFFIEVEPHLEGPFPELALAPKLKKVCRGCHQNCEGGCSGPSTEVGDTGCNSCRQAIVYDNGTIICMNSGDKCPDGYYNTVVHPSESGALKPLVGKAVCRRCHPLCSKCKSYGYTFNEDVCQECTYYRKKDVCTDEHTQGFHADAERKDCTPGAGNFKECEEPASSVSATPVTTETATTTMSIPERTRPFSNEQHELFSDMGMEDACNESNRLALVRSLCMLNRISVKFGLENLSEQDVGFLLLSPARKNTNTCDDIIRIHRKCRKANSHPPTPRANWKKGRTKSSSFFMQVSGELKCKSGINKEPFADRLARTFCIVHFRYKKIEHFLLNSYEMSFLGTNPAANFPSKCTALFFRRSCYKKYLFTQSFLAK